MYTVRQLARIAGVTVRTLHHYDHIGLLEPSSVGENGYRYYTEQMVYRLQQIRFYRELDMPLDEIRTVLGSRGFDLLVALEAHRLALQGESRRLQRLIRTIDRTTRHLKERTTMNPKALFEGFSEEDQAKYAQEAASKWDAETVRKSNERWKATPPAQRKKILEEGRAVYTDLAAAMPKGAASSEVQTIVRRWHNHLRHFWSPDDDRLIGLADLYNDDPRFRFNYEQVAPGLAAFMRAAVQVYVKNREK